MEARWGRAVRAAVVFLGRYSQLARRHRRAQVRVSRTAAACSESMGGGGAQGCTGLYNGRRGRDVDCAANVGAEMAAEASGDVAAAGGARASGRARSETAEPGRERRERKSGLECRQGRQSRAHWLRPCCGCEDEYRGRRSDGAAKSRCKSGFSLAPSPHVKG